MGLLVALVVLYGAGFPVAYVVTGRVTTGALVAPLVTATTAALAALAMTAVGGPLVVWFGAAVVASVIGAWLAAGRPRSGRALVEGPGRPGGPGRLPGIDRWDALILVVPLVVPALVALSPPIEWDARSIWWLHAAWFWRGGSALHGALDNPAFAFSHPDYPPLVPATVAVAWRAGQSRSLPQAQLIGAWLTVTGLATLGYVVRNLVPTVSSWWSRIVGLAVALTGWLLAGRWLATGLVDHLWAAGLASAAVLWLLAGSSTASPSAGPGGDGGSDRPAEPSGMARDGVALAVLVSTVAALTKNEGLLAVAVLAVLVTARGRHDLRRAAWAWLPVGAGLAWSIVVRWRGATSDLASSPTLGELRAGDLSALERVRPVAGVLWDLAGWFALASVLVSVAGAVVLGGRRRDAGLRPVRWLWALVVAYGLVVVVTYVISPYDVVWHLGTSADRVLVAVVLVLATINASWVLTALPHRSVGRGR